jgi:hypothetical protein
LPFGRNRRNFLIRPLDKGAVKTFTECGLNAICRAGVQFAEGVRNDALQSKEPRQKLNALGKCCLNEMYGRLSIETWDER